MQAEILAALGFRVSLIHEDAISKFMDRIDLAIFGADLITKSHFVNKTGTYPISLVFNHFHKPVYVLAESRKVIEVAEINPAGAEEKKPASELYPGTHSNIDVHNLYFETVPLSVVTKVFFEKQTLKADRQG